MIEIPQKSAQFIHEKTDINFFILYSKFTNSLFKFEDEINIFRLKKNLLDGKLPIYNLELGKKSLQHLDNTSKESIKRGYLGSQFNLWTEGKLTVDGKEYGVKVKLHGDGRNHWAFNLKSYKIKTKRTEYINNMRDFNLIIFEDRLLYAKVTRLFTNKLNLMDIRDDIVVLKINGVIQGLYYLQERLDYDFLEYNECSNCEIIKITDNFIEDKPHSIVYGPHLTPYDYTLSNIDLPESELDLNKVLYQTDRLFRATDEKNTSKVISYFDIDQLSSFEALRMLIANSDMITGYDRRLAYAATNGKFYPVPINAKIAKLKLENGGLEHHLNRHSDPHYRPFIDLFYLLNKDDQLRYMKHKKVYEFILSNSITKEIDELAEFYLPYILSYKMSYYNTRIMRYRINAVKEIIEHNMELIKKNLENSKVYVNVIEKGNRVILEIIPESIAEIKFNNLKLNLSEEYSGKLTFIYDNDNIGMKSSIMIEDKTDLIDLMIFVESLYFAAGLDENLYPEKRVYKLEIIFDDVDKILVENLDISMRNDITNKKISKGDTYVQIADGNDFYELPAYFSFDEFKKEYPQFKWIYNDKNGELTLLEGNYILTRDLIIPKTNKLTIDAGVNILIAKNKSILSYSPVNILGTKDNPVLIKALDKNNPFGTFAILGEGKNKSKSVINWLELSDGSEKWINSIYFSGQLSIYHMDVDINNTSIYGSHSDDGLNVKYSNLIIDNSQFYGNFADQVDLDFVTGVVKNSEFIGTGKGVGGDNLDLSGSKILVKNNKFSDSIDKGVSIGEETQALLYKNIISNNNVSVAVKDLSKVYFIENVFDNNKIAINSYQKKQLFGGSFSYIHKNEFVSNDKDFAKDEKSEIYKINFIDDRFTSLIQDIQNDILSFP